MDQRAFIYISAELFELDSGVLEFEVDLLRCKGVLRDRVMLSYYQITLSRFQSFHRMIPMIGECEELTYYS